MGEIDINKSFVPEICEFCFDWQMGNCNRCDWKNYRLKMIGKEDMIVETTNEIE